MGVFLMLECKVVHGMVLIETTALDALYNLKRVDMVFLVDDLHDWVLDNDVLAFEVNEVCPCWLIGQTELTGP